MKSLNEVIEMAKMKGRKRVAVVGAEDVESLKAVYMAHDAGFAEPVLVGDPQKIKESIAQAGLQDRDFSIVSAVSSVDAAEKGVRLVSSKSADVLMKGYIKTSELLKAVLNKEWGLRTGSVLSHVAVAETPALSKLILITDGGMLVRPTLDEKVAMINNSVAIAASLEIKNPKVAVIAAVEVVNPDMPETLDAAILTQMNKRGQIKNCLVDGPLGLDNALSLMAAKIKHIEGDVAGQADILVVPDIHSGNFLGKSAIYLAGGKIAGIIAGAKAPIVIISRADEADSKLCSLALGVLNS
ncbi:MAG TPA: bifunctional enoyl-CoA hydratase/phosphate acetyltransferase [Petrotogaceae bacterium]|jgi:phosphate butyryltransferase|nr:bifunctional enoyl-CoA hydratase/phosphate acetyltransferase [Petrotogaceae bacterium]HNY36425.1 bifunctional enoyl-CoA hydratase/phosphate acetyltransferase [Petrotogaceae bacterium]HOG33637.1 bifunctional enoyl-CoA hydratase/phosphate acetyltransferase [Petrotogaceae bacterium]HPO27439.1 bifunctional enoyl-CoA hydratase/phosphate acetyltransferase [Petrotogaceae bacterium]